jgi:hypothetical protein
MIEIKSLQLRRIRTAASSVACHRQNYAASVADARRTVAAAEMIAIKVRHRHPF